MSAKSFIPVAALVVLAASFHDAERSPAPGPAFFAISVADLDATVRWYRNAFPTLTEHRLTMPDTMGGAALLESPEIRIEILALRRARPPARPRSETYLTHGFFKSGFSVPALAPYLTRFAEQKITVDAGPFVDSVTMTRSVVVADNEGNLLHLFESLH